MPKYGFQLCADYSEKKHPANAIAEIKYDGMMVLVERGRIVNRDLRDVTFRFPDVQVHPNLVVVGEIVVLVNGVSDFNLLLKRQVDNPKEIRLRSRLYPATLIAFDILEVNGQDLTSEPLSKRRTVLESLDKTKAMNGNVLVAGYWGCPPEKVNDYVDLMRAQFAEGIVVKNLDSPYKPARNDAWMKFKAWQEEDFDLLGFDVTEKGGFVVWIENKGYKQKVVVNRASLAEDIRVGKVHRLRIRYLSEEPSGALRQPHVFGVAWHK